MRAAYTRDVTPSHSPQGPFALCGVPADRRLLQSPLRRQENVTVGKTFVADLIRRYCYEFALTGRGVRRAKPKRVKLTESIRRFGKPHAVRTDNEPVFTSRVFRLALLLLGIRHQRTDLHSPCQNGQVERFFGTLQHR